MVLVVTLTIRRDSVEEYRATSIMAKHGARIERTVIVQSDQDRDTLKEVHVVRFPNSKALMAYKTDPETTLWRCSATPSLESLTPSIGWMILGWMNRFPMNRTVTCFHRFATR